MKGLILKDFFVIAKQLKIFLVVIPVMALIGGISMSAFAVLIGAMLPMTAIAYDERSKWNELAAMMPYSKMDLVLNKYLLGYTCIFCAALLAALGQLIFTLFVKEKNHGSVAVLILAVFVGLVFIAIDMPIMFKFGTEKGRFVFIISIALISASGALLQGADNTVILKVLSISPLLLLTVAILLNVISILISVRIKSKS